MAPAAEVHNNTNVLSPRRVTLGVTGAAVQLGTIAMTAADHDSSDSIFAALQRQDALGALLRAHFQLQARLQHWVRAQLPYGRELPDLDYQAGVRLAVALGLDGRLLSVLQMLGHLRDCAARHFSAGLSDASVDELFGLLAGQERAAVLERHRQHADGIDFQHAAPLYRFNVIVAAVDAVLLEVTRERVTAAPQQSTAEEEVVTFEWSAPAPAPLHARDFASRDALYSWLTASDR